MDDNALKKAVDAYLPGELARSAVKSARIVLLVGISGAGKDTLKRKLLAHDHFYNFVSHTTRKPRMNHGIMEVDGHDYFFINEEEAIAMLAKGEFIEAKQYSGNVYGTAIEGLEKAEGNVAVNDVEVQGVEEYKRLSSDVKAIFILPPSAEQWRSRLSNRYHGTVVDEKDITERTNTAVQELQFALEKGYFEFLINDDLEQAVDALVRIINGHRDHEEHQAGIRKAEELLRDIGTH